jgi:hypothetical protein
MITLLQLVGLGNSNHVRLAKTDVFGYERFLEIENISPLLEILHPKYFKHKKLLYGGKVNVLKMDISPDIIYNSISDPDRCSDVLKDVIEDAQDNPFPYINHPKNVYKTKSDKTYQLSKNIDKLNAIKTICVNPLSLKELVTLLATHDIRAPFRIKEAGKEWGEVNHYIFKESDDVSSLERFAFDGRAYYISPYVDYSSEDGLFRKYRFFLIGEKIIPGHLIISNQWYIKNDRQAHVEIDKELLSIVIKEEQAFLQNNDSYDLKPLFELKSLLDLDFCGVDCYIDDNGIMGLFSISCSRHYFDTSKEENYYSKKQIHTFNKAVEAMILSKINKR